MRYLVKARVRPGEDKELLDAVASGELGRGSVAGDEYLRNMHDARLREDGSVQWVEVCYCATPLEEERPYWEKYFELVQIKDAHRRSNCRDENGSESWACENCDCTARLESRLARIGRPFLDSLKESIDPAQ
jgi:hypothetical protein